MTDYSKWDKFDVDEAERKVDQKHELELKQRQQRSAYSSGAKEHETTLRNAQKRAEALESKVCIDSLHLCRFFIDYLSMQLMLMP